MPFSFPPCAVYLSGSPSAAGEPLALAPAALLARGVSPANCAPLVNSDPGTPYRMMGNIQGIILIITVKRFYWCDPLIASAAGIPGALQGSAVL